MTATFQTSRTESAGPELAEAIAATSTHTRTASATPLAGRHTLSVTQNGSAPATQLSNSQNGSVTQSSTAVADPSPAGGHARRVPQMRTAPGGWLRDPVLGVLADVVDDLESVRMANANRVRQLTRTGTDKDGEERGFGLTLDHPEVAKLALTVQALEAAEKDAIRNLQRAMRKHPLAAYQKRHKGIGEKQLARLLAVIGDPYWNDLHQRPRTVSELWAFAGLHVVKTSSSSHVTADTHRAGATAGTQPHAGSQSERAPQPITAPGVAPKRTRGQRSNWSETARMRVWVIASAIPKFPGSTYEQVYRDGRMKYADAIHTSDCVRCGPAGKPAPAGSPLSDGHKHARAVRLTAKAILRDLWIEARDLYTTTEEKN